MTRYDILAQGLPISDEEIAGFMNWRGPGAYTAHAMRKVKESIAEAVLREREACAKVCEEIGPDLSESYGDGAECIATADACAEAIRARNKS